MDHKFNPIPTVNPKVEAFRRLAELTEQTPHLRNMLNSQGVPKSEREMLELTASVIWNDLQLQSLLLIVDKPYRRQVYEDIKPKLRFQPRPFEDVVNL